MKRLVAGLNLIAVTHGDMQRSKSANNAHSTEGMKMTVKRYDAKDINGGLCISEDATGRYAAYEDYAELQRKLTAYEATVTNLTAQVQGLAVENSRLNDVAKGGAFVMQKALMKYEFGIGMTEQAEHFIRDAREEFKATDAALAEIRNEARAEGINFAASRLAAAFNNGFIDKPLPEVFDVTRMILDTKSDLANAPVPAPDGLSGEYAETALKEWAEQLRKEQGK
ncbi:Uncharacterised protein [Cedecea lapagei]|uniref:Uncharacterized protein n=1 Tax=Cedecea lapagei TaxID=158823 RepID=A0A447V5W0_9ENTR|nr:DUF4752 domain-containing protein [Cedecea lapagei]VEC00265.1 Uncharacterised protein [Cedecea lapagei]